MNPRAARRFVAYYRVSTDQTQGRSGLRLEAQQKAVMDYLNGGAWDVMPSGRQIFAFFCSPHDRRAENSGCGYTA